MLEEFNEYFKGNIDDKSFLHCNTIYVKSFLLNKIAEALAEDRERVVEEINDVLDIAKGKLYPYQDEKERLEIVIEKLLDTLSSLDKPLTYKEKDM